MDICGSEEILIESDYTVLMLGPFVYAPIPGYTLEVDVF